MLLHKQRAKCLPACQESVNHEHQVGRLLADGCAKVVIPPVVDQQQLSQTRPKDGRAEESAAKNESEEEPIIPLQQHNTI